MNTSHITQMLKKQMRADSKAKQLKADSQILLLLAEFRAQWKKEKRSFKVCQNTRRGRGESYFEKYYRNGLSPIDKNEPSCLMRAGHSRLKASSSRLNTVHAMIK
jgi:hypothetical protein